MRICRGFHRPVANVAVSGRHPWRCALTSIVVTYAAGAGLARAQAAPKYAGACSQTACHGEFAKRRVVHAPVSAESCDACHEEADAAAHTFSLTNEGAALCTDCHDAFEGKVRHGPVAEGCTTCHDPHGSHAAKLLTGDSIGALCADCHDDLTEGKGELHGPVAVGDCTTCHAAHASDHEGLLLQAQPKLCIECHEDAGEALTERKHVHAPVKEACTTCHDPHASSVAHFLTGEPNAICSDCHSDVVEAAQEAAVKHSPVTTNETCMGCHDVHGSDQAGMLKTAEKSLCLGCHDQPIVQGDRQIGNIAEALSGDVQVHGPLQDGQCAVCHAGIHGADRTALLGKAFPPGFYVSFAESAYELCFDCHDVEAFAEPQTDEATAFRNGTQNLHYVHVHREKGRSCRVCHDPHSSVRGKLITEGVPFGRWRIPIQFQGSASGGSCQPGCHRAYRYDREAPIANLTPRP